MKQIHPHQLYEKAVRLLIKLEIDAKEKRIWSKVRIKFRKAHRKLVSTASEEVIKAVIKEIIDMFFR